MDKNQIKIVCNPYDKRMQYYWLEENGHWEDLCESEDSALNSDKYTVNVSLSKNAHAILDILVSNYYNKTVGLKIIFEGTDDDFSDLELIRINYFYQYDIEIVQSGRKLQSARAVMPKIEAIFGRVEDYFKEYPDKETEGVISKYRDTVRPEIALCVMGLYSSGKSAFINSLIGKEILPSDSDPATAKVYEIEEGSKLSVKFDFDGKEYTIEYSENKWKSSQSFNSEIISFVKKEFEDKGDLSSDALMYWTLSALNKYAKFEGDKQHVELINAAHEIFNDENVSNFNSDDEFIELLLRKYRIRDLVGMGKVTANKLGAVIHVQTTFVNSYLPLDSFKFVIYDTPGSNSVQFREHADVLKDSLEQQTNGLPIFVTTPDSMDEKDNKEIIGIINELGNALDVSNMMLIVNKADEKSKSTLQKKSENQDNLVLTKWKANRAYFVSAIMGLGAKKEHCENEEDWIDEDYFSIFEEKYDKFSNPASKLYLRLFDYNILPIDAKERIAKQIINLPENELLIWNSGMPCVEEDIGIFAQKYALYNKCAEALKYLSTAISTVSIAIEKAEEEAEIIRDRLEAEFDNDKKELIKKLDTECETAIAEFEQNFAENVIKIDVQNYESDKRIKDIIESVYGSTVGRNNHDKLDEFNDEIEKLLRNDVKRYAQKTSGYISDYWTTSADVLRDKLMKIVVDSPVLNAEQKEALKNVVLTIIEVPENHKELKIKNTKAVYWDFKFLGIWYWTRISIKKAIEQYKQALNIEIAIKNKTAATENEKEFRSWIDRIKSELDGVVASFNPKLIEETIKLNQQKQLVENKTKQKIFIQAEFDEMKGLTSFEEV